MLITHEIKELSRPRQIKSLQIPFPRHFDASVLIKISPIVAREKNNRYLCPRKAQMAESVDALVSNTSGAIHPGSIPGLGTKLGSGAICSLLVSCDPATHWSARI